MININILSRSASPFYPNWDKERYSELQYNICFNSKEDIDWDCVVVYQDIVSEVKFRCRDGNVIYVSGEPPLMAPCPKSFTDQFDFVVVTNKKIVHPNRWLHHGYLSWHFGYDFKTKRHRYDYKMLKELEPQKTKLISIITSNQRMMPGHNKRMALIEQLRRDFPDSIDVFGKGIKYIDCKADALLPYRFHICIENSSIPYYWTEKISDPILAKCVPIYAGCTNISDDLGSDGYFKFDVNDYNSLKSIIKDILDNPEKEYENKKQELEKIRIKLMEHENMIPFCVNYAENHKTGNFKKYSICPLVTCRGYKKELMYIRLKRYIFKQIFKMLGTKYSSFLSKTI